MPEYNSRGRNDLGRTRDEEEAWERDYRQYLADKRKYNNGTPCANPCGAETWPGECYRCRCGVSRPISADY